MQKLVREKDWMFGRGSASAVCDPQKLVSACRGSESTVNFPQMLVRAGSALTALSHPLVCSLSLVKETHGSSASTVSGPQTLVKAGRGLVGAVTIPQRLNKVKVLQVQFASAVCILQRLVMLLEVVQVQLTSSERSCKWS